MTVTLTSSKVSPSAMDLKLPHAKSDMLGRSVLSLERTDGWTDKAIYTIHQAGQVKIMTAATTTTVETVETMTVMVQTQVVEATTNLDQQAALSQITTVPTLRGSTQVQDNNPEAQPQVETVVIK